MSHQQQLQYCVSLRNTMPDYFINKKVLEIGSLDINGSVRPFFHECEYTGVDLGPGVGVDVIAEGQNYDAPDESFDTVLSTECFEHNPHWKETFSNMIRMCKKKGLVFFTCATDGRGEHGTSRTDPGSSPLTIGKGWEYYQNLNEKHFTDSFNLNKKFIFHSFSRDLHSCDLYFFGIKK